VFFEKGKVVADGPVAQIAARFLWESPAPGAPAAATR
jgi:hypothetical protein